ncbi:MAG TPA: MBL fold metallo-hydrolase [Candidatus Merdenecus merdavium]|nr:MBL fold metallo-hydrolase [Candidatus Merdenecus merdavium]
MNLCSITSGSSGNCIYIGSEKDSILVDVGISGKRVEQGLNKIDMTTKDIQGILITHEHSDHIKGVGVLARKYEIPIYGTKGTISAMKESSSLGKIPDDLFREIKADESFQINDLNIQPFAISHDAAEPVAYRVEHQGNAVAIATDLGTYDDYIIEHLKNLDVLLLEANHDINMLQVGSYPYYLKQRILGNRGHLSNDTAGRLLCEILHDDLKEVILGHLSKDNNYEALAYETVCSEVTMGENPYKASDFHIRVAKRDGNSDLIAI